jgi:hypothetical protein
MPSDFDAWTEAASWLRVVTWSPLPPTAPSESLFEPTNRGRLTRDGEAGGEAETGDVDEKGSSIALAAMHAEAKAEEEGG